MSLSKVKIGEIGEIVTGNTPPRKNEDYFGNAYPWIKPTDIEIDYRYVENPEEYYSKLAYEKYKNALLPEGATCVVTIGTVGKKLCLTLEPSFTNQSINAIIPNQEEFDNDFVYYLMKYNLPKVSKADPGTASGRHHISKSNFSNIEVEVPEKKTQQKIASILSVFDDLIENNTRRIEILEEMARLIYREWFVHYRYPGHESDKLVDSDTDLGEIPKGWEVKQLKDFINFKNGKSARDKEGDRYPIYGANGIIGKSDESKWENGIIIGRVGAYCGEVKYCEGKFWASDNTIVGTPKDEYDYPLFSYLKLEDLNLRRYAGGSAQPLMTQTVIKDIQTVVPSIESMGEFQIIASKFWKQKRTLEKQNERLKQTRDLLLPKLISGKVEVEGTNIN